MAEHWISSNVAIMALARLYDASDRYADYETTLVVAAETLLNRLANGVLHGRAKKGVMTSGNPFGEEKVETFNDALMPSGFWRALQMCEHKEQNLDWVAGDFSYFAGSDEHCVSGKAFNVYFDASAVPGAAVALADVAAQSTSLKGGGRPARFDWPDAVLAVFGLIYRGELKPTNQADIERALLSHLSDGEGPPSESTVRPYAKRIWDEYSKA